MKRAWSDPLLVCALALLAVSPALLGRPFYTGDLLLYFYPLRHTLAEGWAAFGASGFSLPAWDDATGCGMPLCADPQAMCYDPAALLYALLDLPRALGAEVGLRLALIGLGTWVFLRGRELPSPAALVGAVSAMLGGITVSLVGRLDKLGALACLPWIFVAVERQARGRRGGLGLLVGALCLGGLSGGLEVWAMGLGGGLLWAALGSPGLSGGARVRGAGTVLLAFVLALGLSAWLWLPFAHLIGSSSREGGIPFSVATQMSASPAELLGLLLPELFNDPGAMTSRLYPGAPSELWYLEVIAPGWLCLALAGRSLYTSNPSHRAAARALLGLSAACALLALGRHTPVYGWLFAHLPGFSLWRYPEKFLIPLGFALPVMAGLGLAEPLSGRAQRGLIWGGVALALVGASLAGPLASRLALRAVEVLRTGSELGWLSLLRRVGTGLTLHGLALSGAVLLLPRGSWGPRLAALVVAADLLLVHVDVNPPGPPELVARSSASGVLAPGMRIEALSAGRGARLFLLGQDNLETALSGFRASLYPDLGKLDGLRHADSVRAIRPAGPTRLFGAVQDGPIEGYLRALELAGVEVAVSTRPKEDRALAEWPGAQRLASAAATGVTLWQLHRSAPALYRTEEARPFPSPSAMVEALAAGSWDGRTLGLLERDLAARALPERPTEAAGRWTAGETELVERRPGHILARTRGEGPGWLVLLETWDEGWQATVNGVEAPVLHAQGAFIAVPVPGESATVTLDYRAPGRRWGVALSLLSAGGLLGLGLRRRAAQRPSLRSASATMP